MEERRCPRPPPPPCPKRTGHILQPLDGILRALRRGDDVGRRNRVDVAGLRQGRGRRSAAAGALLLRREQQREVIGCAVPRNARGKVADGDDDGLDEVRPVDIDDTTEQRTRCELRAGRGRPRARLGGGRGGADFGGDERQRIAAAGGSLDVGTRRSPLCARHRRVSRVGDGKVGQVRGQPGAEISSRTGFSAGR